MGDEQDHRVVGSQAVASDAVHHYGGEHHRFSLIDRLGERVNHELDAEIDQRDPAFIARLRPALDAALRWFDPVVRGFEHLPTEGPFLVVGNHSGGLWMPDYWAFFREWLLRRGEAAPLYSLGFDFLFSIPGMGTLARKLGSVPASHANAHRLLERGLPLLVYPGGDAEDYRPWTARNRIDMHGHTGFVRLALRHHVPVYPMVSHGSHDVIIVLTRGERLARMVGVNRLRANIMPIVAGPPWGIAPIQLPTFPLPAKVTVQVCEPMGWGQYGPDAADDPEIVRLCYEEVLGRMQATLDDMVTELPHPIATRVASALGLDRLVGR
jgi:1-acyl-sn-glycerol-3-phosphate acyltransferase